MTKMQTTYPPKDKRKDFSLVNTLPTSCHRAKNFKSENVPFLHSQTPHIHNSMGKKEKKKRQQPTTFHISDLFFL